MKVWMLQTVSKYGFRTLRLFETQQAAERAEDRLLGPVAWPISKRYIGQPVPDLEQLRTWFKQMPDPPFAYVMEQVEVEK